MERRFYDTINLQPQCSFLLLIWSLCPLPDCFLSPFSPCPCIRLVHPMLHLCGVIMCTPFSLLFLFNWSFSSRVCLHLASQPFPPPKLICNYFRAAQSSLYLNYLDQIALHLLSFIIWNQFIPLEGFSISLSSGLLSLILLTVKFFFCLYPTCPKIFS